MTENIKSIFNINTKLIGLMHKAVIHFRRGEYNKALSIIADSMETIHIITEAVIKDREYFNLVSTDSIIEMLEGIVNAQRGKDYVLLADLIELQIIMFLCNVQELIVNKEDYYIFSREDYEKVLGFMIKKLSCSDEVYCKIKEDLEPELLLEKGYRIEFTSCGQMTLAVTDADGLSYYMHSNHIITGEAYQTADQWYEKGIKRYIVYGFGMGYAVDELLKLSACDEAEVFVYEHDLNVLKLACGFGGIEDMCLDERLMIIYDPELTHIKQGISGQKDEKVCIFHPSFRSICNQEIKEFLKKYIPWTV